MDNKLKNKKHTPEEYEKTIKELISILEMYLDKTPFLEMYEDSYRYTIELAKQLIGDDKK